MTVKILSIAGTFFQRSERLSISHQSETEGGTVAIITEELMSHVFSGHCSLREEDGYFEGVMIDTYGPSDFRGILLDDRLTFWKYYLRTRNGVSYTYKKCGNIWIGTYEGDVVPQGPTRCVITEISENLFANGPAITES
jgi:hypothetical protein